MGVLGKSRQGCFGVVNNIGAITNLLTSKAILVLPSTGLSNYEQLLSLKWFIQYSLCALNLKIQSAS